MGLRSRRQRFWINEGIGKLIVMVASPRIHPEEDDFGSVERRLAELAALEADWDSYGAYPPTPAALDGARQFLTHVEELYWRTAGERTRPTSISPLPSGGIELEWRKPEELIAVDIGADGRWGYLRKIGSGRDARYEEADDIPSDLLLSLVAKVFLPHP
jgi:hypothetical protein